MAKPRFEEKYFPYLLLAPATIFLFATTIYATVYVVWLSFCKWNVYHPVPVFGGLTNFITLIADAQFWQSVARSAIFIVGAVGGEIILGFAIALLLNRRIAGLGVLRAAFLFPMVFTPIVTGLTWRIMFDPTLGLLNYLLSLFGLPGSAWVATAKTALPALILVDIWQWTPFAFLVMAAGLSSLPLEPFEAARIDGAGKLQTFRFVTLPGLRQVIAVLVLLRTVDAFKTFDIFYVITGGGPGSATQTLTFYSFLRGFQWFQLGYAAAIALIMLTIVTVGAQLFIKLTGVKIFVD